MVPGQNKSVLEVIIGGGDSSETFEVSSILPVSRLRPRDDATDAETEAHLM
jgi:hypothetical protein